MRIAILSDIHGNIDALEAVIRECKKRSVEEFIFLGDFIGYYYAPKEVLSQVQNYSSFSIKGNHEKIFEKLLNGEILLYDVTKKYGNGHSKALHELSEIDIEWLSKLKNSETITLNNIKIQLNHGAPWDPEFYFYPDTSEKYFKRLNEENVDYILVGHSHYSFTKRLNKTILINPGSVGQNRRKGGIADWAIIDTHNNEFYLVNTPYDTKRLIRQIQKNDPNNKYLIEVLNR